MLKTYVVKIKFLKPTISVFWLNKFTEKKSYKVALYGYIYMLSILNYMQIIKVTYFTVLCMSKFECII